MTNLKEVTLEELLTECETIDMSKNIDTELDPMLTW